MKSEFQNIYFESTRHLNRQVRRCLYEYFTLFVFSHRISWLAFRFTRLHFVFLFCGNIKFVFFQRKLERKVEILLRMKEVATVLLTKFSVNVKDNIRSCKTKISANTNR
jgi:hypothetical protein